MALIMLQFKVLNKVKIPPHVMLHVFSVRVLAFHGTIFVPERRFWHLRESIHLQIVLLQRICLFNLNVYFRVRLHRVAVQ